MAELRTRPPTGRVAYPLILVEGEEKAGKSFALAQLAASPRVGRTFALDTGDGTMDEYASLTDGRLEILVHDGTWPSMIEQIEAATKVPQVDGKPNVVGIDSGSAIWQMLKVWTDNRARNSRSGRKTLAEDPDAEIDAPMNLWNDSKGRWGRMIALLKNFDGIGVILAQGQEVTKVENGTPTKDTVWTVEAEKNTAGAVSAIVRIRRPHAARLMGVRSLSIEVPADGFALPDQNMIDHVVFEILGAGEGGFVETSAVAAQPGTPTAVAKARIVSAIAHSYEGLSEAEQVAEALRLWVAYGLPPKGVEEVSTEAFTALLVDIGDGRTQTPPDDPEEDPQGDGGTEPDPSPQDDPTPAQEPQDGPPPEDTGEGTGEAPPTLEALQAMKGRELVEVAKAHGLSPAGKVAEVLDRIVAHLYPAADEDAAAKVAEAFPGTEPESAGEGAEYDGLPISEPQSGTSGEDLPEVIDVPEGWDETRCLCGEPMTYKPGDQTRTSRHLDPTLDADHKAEEPF